MRRIKRVDGWATEHFSDEYDIPIEIRKLKRRKTLDTQIEMDKLIIKIPEYVPTRVGEVQGETDYKNYQILLKYVEKIYNKYKHIYSDGGIEKKLSKSDLKSLVESWIRTMDLPDQKIQVRSVRGVWGTFRPYSNSDSGLVTLIPRLLYFPEHLVESVVVHELVHAKQWLIINEIYPPYARSDAWSNSDPHGPDFWRIFNSYLPNNKQLDEELDDHWRIIFKEGPPGFKCIKGSIIF